MHEASLARWRDGSDVVLAISEASASDTPTRGWSLADPAHEGRTLARALFLPGFAAITDRGYNAERIRGIQKERNESMHENLITLANAYLTARFSTDGRLVHLSANGGGNLVAGAFHRYLEKESQQWFGHPTEPKSKPFECVRVEAGDHVVTTEHRTEHLAVVTRYELPKKSPLLAVHAQVKTTGRAGRLIMLGFPCVPFGPDFNDVFEDERDHSNEGAELGHGRELPCWRVFFQRSHKSGLLLATRSKRQMGEMNFSANGFEATPGQFCNYATNPVPSRPPIDASKRATFDVRIEIGPWSASNHKCIVRRARLDQPVRVAHPPAKGMPATRVKGKVFHAVQFARAKARTNYSPRSWMLAKMPWARKGKALVAGTGVRPPALTLDPTLKGLYRVFVGIANGDGIALRLSGDPETSIRVAKFENERADTPAPFMLFLAGKHRPAEVCYGVARMDGRTVRIERFPNTFGTTVLDYVRFEPLSVKEARAWEAAEDRKPSIALSGFNDIPDIAPLTDVTDPDPAAYRANIWEHARCGFKRIYWRIDGQCSDFPSKTNTMRYISAKVHGVFAPMSKAYGRVLKKTDMLRLAVDAAKKYGVELYGWMRFNNYTGNVQSDFFKKNREYWEEWESGYRGGKLCLAIPEVRKHKIDILVEAAGYGLQGLNLGFLRHPPILLYHPVIVESYRKKYGALPPRDPSRKDARYLNSLPPTDEEHTRWFQHRADSMTIFGRDLRAALKAKGLGHVKISLWLRPNHCLFDGIDLPAWLDQGLCDEVVCNGMIGPERCYSEKFDPVVCGLRPEWKQMVQAKVPLVRCLAYQEISRWKRELPEVLAEGYEGLCTYESDWAVLDTDFIDLYRSLRT